MGKTKSRANGGAGVKPPKLPKYKSGFESKGAAFLTEQGIPFEYESIRIPFVVPSKKRTYSPDFILPNGIICEYKGKLDRLVREKMALVFEQNPHLDIRFLFMRDNKISKNSKTRYSDWCIKRGIKYAVNEHGHIPEEWLVEARAAGSLDGSARLPSAGSTATAGKRKPSVRTSERRGLDGDEG